METLHTLEQQRLPGHTILHLIALTPGEDIQLAGTRMNTKELMSRLVFGDGLTHGEQLIIDGQDARNLLPRPEAYGNSRLALMALLDSMPQDAEMMLHVENINQESLAAD